ncbi:SusC/RagA family TonB-linked outer membrane protein [Niastella sp. OAS944]|uniref:SusC/RagA family TonB-linked outer membrane protein n=1 Tax=Niastella sp. OAS944 TaxID=2664089 RepID=UPI00346D1888|nr:TonB-linked SusC/RagA family outer membrane protein [Chitinophagaceae bacterium OAS944]
MRTKLLIRDSFALFYKPFLIVTFSFLLLVFNHPVQAQNQPLASQRVTVKVDNASLDEVLQILRRQVKLQFVIEANVSDKAQHISLNMTVAPLSGVLDKILAGTGLEYVFNKNVVIIRKISVPMVQEESVAKIQYGQVTITVKGDEGSLLGGATVSDHSDLTKTGLVDSKGQLTLTLKPSAVLRVSYIGYETQIVGVNNRKQLTVILKTAGKSEDEVVITGYQNLRTWESVGATSKVKGEDIRIAGITRVDVALQGQIPGVAISVPNGTVGSNPKIRVRGTSTLLGNREPVWVVDGIIREDPFPFKDQNLDNILNAADKASMTAGLSIMSNGIAGLNPDDIEDITFLKDASATALYGVRAANGVIVITSKRGKAGKSKINFRTDHSITEKPGYNRQDLMNSAQRVALSKELIEKGVNYAATGPQGNVQVKEGPQNVGYESLYYLYINKQITQQEFNDGVTRLEQNNTDWFNELYRYAHNQNYTLSISGGSDKATYYGSLGYSATANSAIGNDQKRLNALMNMEYRLNKRMRWHIGLQANALKNNGFYSNVNPEQYALYTNRELTADQYYSTVNSTTSVLLANGAYSTLTSNLKYNFINERAHTGNTTDSRGLTFNTDLQVELTKDLNFQTMLSGSFDRSTQERWADENSFFVAQIRGANLGELPKGSTLEQASVLPRGGVLEREDMNRDGYLFRNTLQYNRKLGDGMHNFNLMGGFEVRNNTYKGVATKNYGYFPDRGDVVDYDYSIAHPGSPTTSSDAFADKYYNRRTNTLSNFVSYFTSLTYSFKRKYTINLNGRSDASNRFGQYTNASFNPVWAIGARWDVLAEKWFKHRLTWINDLTVRSSFGFQGNIVEDVGPNLIAQYTSPIYNPLNGESYLVIKTMPYPDLRKERTRTWNIGMDFSMLKNRVSFTFDYYYKYSKDLISQRTVPIEYGTAQMYVNGSDMTNRGYDLSVKVVPVRTRDWMWSLQFNTSINKNSVEQPRYTPNLKTLTNGTALVNGYPVDGFWSFRYAGLNHNSGRAMFKYLDVDTNKALLKDPDATKYLAYSGNANPKISGGINTSLRYKNLSLSAMFNIQLSYYLRLNPIMQAGSNGQYQAPAPDKNASLQLVNRWQKPGDEAYTDIPAIYATDEGISNTEFGGDKSIALLAGSWYRYTMYNYSDLRVVNGSHLRCNNIMFSWNITGKQLAKLKVLNQLTFSANVTNPFIIASKKLHGQDPEVLTTDASKITPTLTRMRTFSFGLNAGF